MSGALNSLIGTARPGTTPSSPITINNWASWSATGTGTITSASTILPTGTKLVVSISAGTAYTAFSISDSASGSWTTATAFDNTVSRATQTWIRTTVGTGAAFTVSIAGTGATSRQVALGSYLTNASGLFSSSVQGSGTTTYATITTPAATSVGDLYYVFESLLTGTGTGTSTAGSGFTKGIGIQTNTTVGSIFDNIQYQVATATGTVSAAYSQTGISSPVATKTTAVVFYVA